MSSTEGPSWKGFDSLQYLFIFGASNCALHRVRTFKRLPEPNPEDPLGTPWPGSCWCEPGTPNWVGHLVKRTQERGKTPPLLVYSFAVGGSTVPNLEQQVEAGFKASTAQWTNENSLFVFWAGGNDCVRATVKDVPGLIQRVLTHVHNLYHNHGARNFLFIGVAATQYYPIATRYSRGKRKSSDQPPAVVAEWNKSLEFQLGQFQMTHPLAKVFYFSAYDFISRIIKDSAKYGLKPEDKTTMGGSIWNAHVHPTSAVHKILANDIEACLRRDTMPETPAGDAKLDSDGEAR